MQICFILFLIDRDEMMKIYHTESPMNFTAAPGVNALYLTAYTNLLFET